MHAYLLWLWQCGWSFAGRQFIHTWFELTSKVGLHTFVFVCHGHFHGHPHRQRAPWVSRHVQGCLAGWVRGARSVRQGAAVHAECAGPQTIITWPNVALRNAHALSTQYYELSKLQCFCDFIILLKSGVCGAFGNDRKHKNIIFNINRGNKHESLKIGAIRSSKRSF